MTRQEILAVARPILFNTEMVRAILDGRKTVMRRIIKQNIKAILHSQARAGHPELSDKHFIQRLCSAPYQPDDYLYVRETWCELYHLADDMCTPVDEPCYYYAADGYNPTPFNSFPDDDGFFGDRDCPRWRPSIHMPKEAARLFLRVTSVRAEQLQEINGNGMEKEGIITGIAHFKNPINNFGNADRFREAVKEFSSLWNSTIKPADLPLHGWEANPWVWVIEFERIMPEETD